LKALANLVKKEKADASVSSDYQERRDKRLLLASRGVKTGIMTDSRAAIGQYPAGEKRWATSRTQRALSNWSLDERLRSAFPID
jgi:hypothetical protein